MKSVSTKQWLQSLILAWAFFCKLNMAANHEVLIVLLSQG